jgi:hypothetical protein
MAYRRIIAHAPRRFRGSARPGGSQDDASGDRWEKVEITPQGEVKAIPTPPREVEVTPAPPGDHEETVDEHARQMLGDLIELLDRQQKMHAELMRMVVALRDEIQTLLAPARKPSPPRRGPALTTLAWITALGAYEDQGESLREDMPPGALARQVKKFAEQTKLAEAHLLAKPDDETARGIAKAFLNGIRQNRARNRR